MYLDAGFDRAKEFIYQNFETQFQGISEQSTFKDAKSQLQEAMQKQGFELPNYEIVETLGEQHAQQFTVQCVLTKLDIQGQATAESRRRAEQAAAEQVLSLFKTSKHNKLKKA